MKTPWAVTFSVLLLLPCSVMAQTAYVQSPLDRATSDCMREVPGGESIFVSYNSKSGAKGMKVKNTATGKKRNDPVVDAYRACVDRKLASGSYAASTVISTSGKKGQSYAAADTSTVGLTRRCMRTMRAPGKYAVAINTTIPRVVPDAGGTATGAHNVQDCLHDALNVQYPSLLSTVEANGGTQTPLRKAYCPKRANVIYGGVQYCRL